MPYLEYGRYRGTVCAPVGTCDFRPDTIIMHVNGMMVSQLLNVRNWIDGKDLYCQLSGHAGCVYAIVPPILTKDCQVAIPCKGDRRYAGAQDDDKISGSRNKLAAGAGQLLITSHIVDANGVREMDEEKFGDINDFMEGLRR